MIDLTGMISIPYLKKTTFTGSEKGTNFMIRKISGEEGEPDKIQAVIWPGPFIFSVMTRWAMAKDSYSPFLDPVLKIINACGVKM